VCGERAPKGGRLALAVPGGAGGTRPGVAPASGDRDKASIAEAVICHAKALTHSPTFISASSRPDMLHQWAHSLCQSESTLKTSKIIKT